MTLTETLKYPYRYIKHVYRFEAEGKRKEKHPDDNVRKIQGLKGTAKKNRCFITATGPSLTCSDLELLSEEDTFGVNSIFLMYEKTAWRPSYYVCTDAPYFRKLIDSYHIKGTDLCKPDGTIFLNNQTLKDAELIGNPDNSVFIPFSPWNRAYDFKKYRFQPDIARGMYAFGTVTNIVMCIAMYMGYTEIYLIGADCSNLNKHFVNDVTDKDKDEKYVKDVIHVQLKGYEIMKKETEKRGVHVFNATRGGALEVFPRVRLEDVIKII